ncbi:hypothetical protein TRFO_35780 [Tritrichomonas foetus]|uniref:Uncharacterized protein n=1 Tax=Tritrichomonas foetus TaxID=1144522 RepID=A0A1J4JGU6_9EUKA|nr:hypothetical protein TRFO_35780 [Tritrichomonas foetus]|eukprot:OHS97905.1 hypothetical protein TRFO_35780 [Tritrichomonas foetus]
MKRKYHRYSRKNHSKRKHSTNGYQPYIMPGIELSPEQSQALQQAKELFMQFRFKQVFAKKMPSLISKVFGPGKQGQAQLKDFLMPHLMPVPVKGSDGKDQIALMPAILQGKVPYYHGKIIPQTMPEISGGQFIPGASSPFQLSQNYPYNYGSRYQQQQFISPEMLSNLLEGISEA